MANFMVGVDYVEDLLSEVDLQTEENKKLVDELLGKKESVSAVPDPDISELEEAPAVGGALVRKLCSGGPLDVVLHRVGFGDASPWWLDDRATGEARGLPKLEPGNVWATGNAGAGDDQRGYAAQYNEESKVTSNWIWLDEFLRLRLHRSSNPPDWEDVLDEAERGLLILDPSTSGTAWRSEQRRAKTARGLTHTPIPRAGVPAGHPSTAHAKFWVYQVERAPSLHLVWELPRICELVFKGILAKGKYDWIRNGLDTWGKYTNNLDLGDGHYQRGSQGYQAAARHKGLEPCGLILAQLVTEPGATTVGVVVAILHFAHPINKKDQVKEAPENGKKAPLPCGVMLRQHVVCVGSLPRVSGAVATE